MFMECEEEGEKRNDDVFFNRRWKLLTKKTHMHCLKQGSRVINYSSTEYELKQRRLEGTILSRALTCQLEHSTALRCCAGQHVKDDTSVRRCVRGLRGRDN